MKINNNLRLITAIFALIIFSLNVHAQVNGTLHLICSIDKYSNIAESCKEDFKNVKNQFNSIASEIKMTFQNLPKVRRLLTIFG